jgi:hypothetical protein
MSQLTLLRFLLTAFVILAGLGAATLPSRTAAQDTSVPGLGGVQFTAPSPYASGACAEWRSSTFAFSTSGTSTGFYAGTFTESGTVTVSEMDDRFAQAMLAYTSTFEIQSPNGHVIGITWLEPGANSENADTGYCYWTSNGYRYSASGWNVRYAATITTPDGRVCTTTGASLVSFAQNFTLTSDGTMFRHTLYANVNDPYPTCTGGGSEEPPIGDDHPIDAPATKEECKDGGWETWEYDNQGRCIQDVNTR